MTKLPAPLQRLRKLSNVRKVVYTTLLILLFSILGLYFGKQFAVIQWPENKQSLAIHTNLMTPLQGDTLFIKTPWSLNLVPAEYLTDIDTTNKVLLFCRWPFRAGVNLQFERPDQLDTSLSIPPGLGGKEAWYAMKDSLTGPWKKWAPKSHAYPDPGKYMVLLSLPEDTLCLKADEISWINQTF